MDTGLGYFESMPDWSRKVRWALDKEPSSLSKVNNTKGGGIAEFGVAGMKPPLPEQLEQA